MEDNFPPMISIPLNPKIETAVVLLVEKLDHRSFDNSNRKGDEEKGGVSKDGHNGIHPNRAIGIGIRMTMGSDRSSS